MPTYDYRREDGTVFEVVQRFSDAPLETCPETGQKVTRLIGGGAGLIFKGSGFYLTDYVKKNGGEAGGNGESKGDGEKKNGPADTTAKAETKSDTKKAPAAAGSE